MLVASGCNGDSPPPDRFAGDQTAAKAGGARHPAVDLPDDLTVDQVAARVARIRGARFEEVPSTATVDSAELVDLQRRLIERRYSPAEQRRDREVQVLLGLLKPDEDPLEVLETVADVAALGFYDVDTKRLRIVRGGVKLDPALAETTLAHELTHALDDQRFGLEAATVELDDRSAALAALREGSASAVGEEYVDRYRGGREPPQELTPEAARRVSDVPAYIINSVMFLYLDSTNFVDALRERADGGWRLVDRALERRPPVSTEQVLHPAKYFVDERPTSPKVVVGPLLDGFWNRSQRGDIGEFDTGQVLAHGGIAPAGAAEGWGGGTYELWRRGGRCALPCTERRVLVLSWDWDTARDEREFTRAMRLKIGEGSGGDPAGGRDSWRLGDGAIALDRRGRSTTVALAPSVELARRLAGRSRR